MAWKRFNYKGTKEQLPKVEAALEKLRVTRKSMYLILKYFKLNPDGIKALEQQFPDV